MLIQVFGGGFDNRGAQLMLLTVIERLRAIDPGVRLAVEAERSTYQERAEHGLLTLAPLASYRSPRKVTRLIGWCDRISRLLPKNLEAAYGLARRCDVDAFVDISGYAFGDKFGAGSIASVAARVKRYRRLGKPVVLLPQMLGPFEQAPQREASLEIIDNADLVYARDERSLECVRKLRPDASSVKLAPDITILTTGQPPKNPIEGRYACLVPNYRMVDKAADTWGPIYADAMVAAAKHVESLGVTPYLVVHDASGLDRKLAEQIAAAASIPADRILQEPDPVKIKGVLAGAEMTIGSRFHALVSSLSSATPVVALGWAHKYESLLDDFAVSDFIASHTEGGGGVLERIDRLADPTQHAEAVDAIRRRKAVMSDQIETMWREVAACLGLP